MAADGFYKVEGTHTALWVGVWQDRPSQTFVDDAADQVKVSQAWSGIHANSRR